MTDDLEFVDIWGVLRENPLHANTTGNFANSERLGNARTTFLDHQTLKNLNTFFSAFLNFIVDFHGITDAVIWKVGSDLVSADLLQNIHLGSSHVCTRNQETATLQEKWDIKDGFIKPSVPWLMNFICRLQPI